MVLYLRVLLSAIRTLFRPAIGPTADYDTEFRVLPVDSEFQFLNGARYWSFAERGLLEKHLLNGFIAACVRHRWRTVSRGHHGTFVRSIRVGQRVSVRVTLDGWDDESFYHRVVFTRGERTAFVGLLKMKIVSRDGAIRTRDVLTAMGVPGESPELPADVRRVLVRDPFTEEQVT